MKKILSVILLVSMVLSLSAFAAGAQGDAIFSGGAPSGIYLASDGTFYITDTFTKVVWNTRAGGEPTVYAGRMGVKDVSGEPIGGYNDAEYEKSAFLSPWAIAPFQGGLIVSDTENHCLRVLSEGEVATAVGNGTPGLKDDKGTASLLNRPTGLAADGRGNIYIADTGNNVIRKLDSVGNLTVYAGTAEEGHADGALLSASFREPTGLCYLNGALYIADSGNHSIRVIKGDTVSTLAGSVDRTDDNEVHEGAYADGEPKDAKFSNPQGVLALSDGRVFIADTGNNAIRLLENDYVFTVSVATTAGRETYPVSPRGMAYKNETLYIADNFAGIVYALPVGDLRDITFTDVGPTAWYYPAVSFVAEKGLFAGTSDTTFSPGAPMTRAMFVTVLSRMHKLSNPRAAITGEAAYDDVAADAYYAAAVSWAADNDIVKGTATGFSPDLAVTRETMATLLFRYCKWAEETLPATGASAATAPDAGAISDWAADGMEWAVSVGILQGSDSGELRPTATATRAEAAQMLMRFWELMG